MAVAISSRPVDREIPNHRDPAAAGDHGHHHYDPITVPEKAGAFLLIAASLVVGLKPDLLFDWITPALQSPAFQAVLKGGTP